MKANREPHSWRNPDSLNIYDPRDPTATTQEIREMASKSVLSDFLDSGNLTGLRIGVPSVRSCRSPQRSTAHMARVGLFPGGVTPKCHRLSARFPDRPEGKRSFNNTGIPAINPIRPQCLLRHRKRGGQQQSCEIRWCPVRSVSRRPSNNPSTEHCVASRSPRRNTPRF